jgi:hypothetical protein
VATRGELDRSTAAELEDRLREALDSAEEVVLDLSRVEFRSPLPAQARRLFELIGLLPRLPLDDGRPS